MPKPDKAARAIPHHTISKLPARFKNQKKPRKSKANKKEKPAKRDINLTACLYDATIPPWILDEEAVSAILQNSHRHIALHYEILQFVRFVSPTDHEILQRRKIVSSVSHIVKGLWPEARVELFGSFPNDIYIPGADIDLVVMHTPDNGSKAELRRFSNALRRYFDFARDITLILKAKVPLVKFLVNDGNIPCDVSFARDNGVQCVQIVAKFLTDFPALRPLLFVIKYFLKAFSLNDPSIGGLGSYSVINMIVSHLQMFAHNFPQFAHGEPDEHPNRTHQRLNLGVFLETFFALYGSMFNAFLTGIQTRDGGAYFQRLDRFPTRPSVFRFQFCIEDPNDQSNDLGRGTYDSKRIGRAFNLAALALRDWTAASSSTAASSNSSVTPLGMLFHITTQFWARRKAVVDHLKSHGESPVPSVPAVATMAGIEFSAISGSRCIDLQQPNAFNCPLIVPPLSVDDAKIFARFAPRNRSGPSHPNPFHSRPGLQRNQPRNQRRAELRSQPRPQPSAEPCSQPRSQPRSQPSDEQCSQPRSPAACANPYAAPLRTRSSLLGSLPDRGDAVVIDVDAITPCTNGASAASRVADGGTAASDRGRVPHASRAKRELHAEVIDLDSRDGSENAPSTPAQSDKKVPHTVGGDGSSKDLESKSLVGSARSALRKVVRRK